MPTCAQPTAGCGNTSSCHQGGVRSPTNTLARLRVCLCVCMLQAHEVKVRKELLEACYDDEIADVERLLAEEVAHVDMADPHGNSLVSEAAAGGALSTLRLIIVRPAPMFMRSLDRPFSALRSLVCAPSRP